MTVFIRVITDSLVPGNDAMEGFIAVDVGLFIALSVEGFSRFAVSGHEREQIVATRTLPPGFALLLALMSLTLGGALGETFTRVIAVLAFIGTAWGLVGLVWSALDHAAGR
jgi:hypothetical protein